MSRKVMQMALEALEGNCTNPSADPEQSEKEDAAITALRQALETEKQWVGLTDEEVSEIIDREIGFNSCWGPEEKFARAVEQALKEKNHG